MSNIAALGGFFTDDDNFQHGLIGTQDAKLHELFFNDQGTGQPILACFESVRAVDGYYTPYDRRRHAIVASSDGYVREVYFSPTLGISEAQLAVLPDVVDVAGFYSDDDGFQHALVATADGNVHEIYFNPQKGIFQDVFVQFVGITRIAGFYTPDDQYRHAIVATSDGVVHEVYFNPQRGIFTDQLGSFASPIVDVDAFYSSDDGYRHAIVATADGNLYEIFFNPRYGIGRANLGNFGTITHVAGYYSQNDSNRHVLMALGDSSVVELRFNPNTGQASRLAGWFPELPPRRAIIAPDSPFGEPYTDPSSGGRPMAVVGDASELTAVSAFGDVWYFSSLSGRWRQLEGSPPQAFCLDTDPLDSRHILIGTLDTTNSPLELNSAGVWETRDRGSSWTYAFNPLEFAGTSSSGSRQQCFAVTFTRLSTAIAATDYGIVRRPNQPGVAFQLVASGLKQVTAFAVGETAAGGDVIWARTSDELLFSTDDGLTWSPAIPIPNGQIVDGFQIGISWWDQFSLACFGPIAVLNGATTAQNNNVVLLYNSDAGTWHAQKTNTNNGTGLSGGPRRLRSFILHGNPVRQLGQRWQLLFATGQDVERAIYWDGAAITWNTIAGTVAGSNLHGPIHSDIWCIHLSSDGSTTLIGGDGGFYISTFFSLGNFTPLNAGLSSHLINTMNVLPARHTQRSRIVYVTQDNGGWFRPESDLTLSSAAWTGNRWFGDMDWSKADQGNPAMALVTRFEVGGSFNLPVGLLTNFNSMTGITGQPVLNTAVTLFDDPNRVTLYAGHNWLQIVQTLKGEAGFPELDAIALADLPVKWWDGANLQPAAAPWGQSSSTGPLVARNTSFATSPNVNSSHFATWTREVGKECPPTTVGLLVSGGHANPTYFVWAMDPADGVWRLFQFDGRNWVAYKQLPPLMVGSSSPGGGNGPAFVNPYDPLHIFALTIQGVFESVDGNTFQYDDVLTALITRSSSLPLQSSLLSDVAFNRDDPSEVVVGGALSGVFYRRASSGWRNLTTYLPHPTPVIGSVAIDDRLVYAASYGRGLVGVANYRNSREATYFVSGPNVQPVPWATKANLTVAPRTLATLIGSDDAPIGSAIVHLAIHHWNGSSSVAAVSVPADGNGNVFIPQWIPSGTYRITARFDGDSTHEPATVELEAIHVHSGPTPGGIPVEHKFPVGWPLRLPPPKAEQLERELAHLPGNARAILIDGGTDLQDQVLPLGKRQGTRKPRRGRR